jgi:small-conductance mechanosensitive channel
MTEINGDFKAAASVALIIIAFCVRWFAVRHFSNISSNDETLPRRWTNSAKNGINLLVALGLVIIWLSELRLIALSLAAFAVAFVIATREFIQCFIGSLYQASARSFSVGDWIKVGVHYGEVVSSDWLSTKLLEIDMETMSYEHTGRTLNVPNHLFISGATHNLNFMRRYVTHTFKLVRDADQVNVFDIKVQIMEKAREYCASFQDVAQRYNDLIERRLDSAVAGPEPTIRVTTTNMGKNEFSISVFCPTHLAVDIEQKLTEDFMEYWYTVHRNRKNVSDKSTSAAIEEICSEESTE